MREKVSKEMCKRSKLEIMEKVRKEMIKKQLLITEETEIMEAQRKCFKKLTSTYNKTTISRNKRIGQNRYDGREEFMRLLT